MFKELYKRVASGQEAERVIEACGARNYQEALGKGTGRTSATPRCGRPAPPSARCVPSEAAKAIAKGVKGVAGRQSN